MNPASLMEVPPDEDELEKILSSSDEKETVEESVSDEVEAEEATEKSNDDVGYFSQ